MSKIEKALRKAADNRPFPKERPPGVSAGSTAQDLGGGGIPVKKRISALLEVAPIKITNVLLATAREEKTAVVEEFNKLRSSVIALTKGDEFLNTLMVTSTVSEEGKSMTALNLAISLAKEHDHTVLLVDTDLRRPSVHKFLGIDPEYGLVHCLRDGLPLEKALIKTGVGKLVILPAGEAIKDPVDMLSSNRMKEIVQELKTRYPERYVIFDTPPSLPFADAGVLANIVDAVLFVVREGRSRQEDVAKALEEFKDHNLLGVVYNDFRSLNLLNDKGYYEYY